VNEPELASGDSGEQVARLQTRLQAVGRYSGAVDGNFGPQTESAVRQLQEDRDLPADGRVGAATWAALGDIETATPLPMPSAELVTGALSEDHHWRWDGDGWQPAHGLAAAPAQSNDGAADRHMPRNGQWVWTGHGWQPVEQ
jgi:peptidoglycan hydrolase-like protein with peptidoglycan-binding domain